MIKHGRVASSHALLHDGDLSADQSDAVLTRGNPRIDIRQLALDIIVRNFQSPEHRYLCLSYDSGHVCEDVDGVCCDVWLLGKGPLAEVDPRVLVVWNQLEHKLFRRC